MGITPRSDCLRVSVAEQAAYKAFDLQVLPGVVGEEPDDKQGDLKAIGIQ